jgi:hypothetical protein
MNTFKLNDSNGSMERTTFRAATVRCLKSFTRALISLAMLGTVVTLGLIFAGHHNRANAHEGCAASTIAGTYAFDLRGFRSPPMPGSPSWLGTSFQSRQRVPGPLTARKRLLGRWSRVSAENP